MRFRVVYCVRYSATWFRYHVRILMFTPRRGLESHLRYLIESTNCVIVVHSMQVISGDKIVIQRCAIVVSRLNITPEWCWGRSQSVVEESKHKHELIISEEQVDYFGFWLGWNRHERRCRSQRYDWLVHENEKVIFNPDARAWKNSTKSSVSAW